MTDNLPVLNADGTFGLSEEQIRVVVTNHFALLEKLAMVDTALIASAGLGDVKAMTLYYKRLGLIRDKAGIDRPELPAAPPQAIWAEAIKRGMLGAPQPKKAPPPLALVHLDDDE